MKTPDKQIDTVHLQVETQFKGATTPVRHLQARHKPVLGQLGCDALIGSVPVFVPWSNIAGVSYARLPPKSD